MEGYQYTWARHSGKYDDVKGNLKALSLHFSKNIKLGTFILHCYARVLQGEERNPFSSSSKLHTSGLEVSSLKALRGVTTQHLVRELTGLTLLLLTSSETIFFGVESLGVSILCTHIWLSLLTVIHVVVYDHQYPGGLVALLGPVMCQM
ncbi:hypothetical protein JHK86_001004 [Glycine max]|nr:hypothetical protein JHK86_001004 [Glycine max]